MIKAPSLGMKVSITDPIHCAPITTNKKGAIGTIVKIDNDESFLVEVNGRDDESWWRCCECVTELTKVELT